MELKGARPFEHLLLGITGAIESANSFDISMSFKAICEELTVILTQQAENYCSPAAIAQIASVNVVTEAKRGLPENPTVLASSIDMFVVAPLSANTLAKLANGIADNTLLSTALAVQCPKVVAPSMSDPMWSNHFVQANLKALAEAGYEIIPPVTGREVRTLKPQYGAMPKIDKVIDELLCFKRRLNRNQVTEILGD